VWGASASGHSSSAAAAAAAGSKDHHHGPSPAALAVPHSTATVTVTGPQTASHAAVDSQLTEMSAIATILSEPLPAWVAIFDTHTYQLTRLICNNAALELFGWSQAEVDLRIQVCPSHIAGQCIN
jgi:PAS domain-containing protein